MVYSVITRPSHGRGTRFDPGWLQLLLIFVVLMDYYGYERDCKLLKQSVSKDLYSLNEGLFYGLRLHCLEIDDTSLLEAITHEGGLLSAMDEADILVSSYCCELESFSTVVSPFWILRVLKARTLEKPHKPLDFPRPLQPIPWKTDDCSTLIAASTGFSPEEKDEIKAMVHLAGGLYSPELAKTVDVLLVATHHDPPHTQSSSKVSFAIKHRIPMVSLQWLEDSWRHWTWLPFTDYLIDTFPIETSKQMLSTTAISP